MKIRLVKVFLIFLFFLKITLAIVGGKDAHKSRYRYIVSLQKYNQHFCSGSIIDKFHILTAAHCIHGKSRHDITIVAGTPYRRSKFGDYYFIYNMMRHQNHMSMLTHPNVQWHDIALIRVTREIHIYDKVQVVALPMIDSPKADDLVAVAGWGQLDQMGWVPRVLKEVHQRILNIDECKVHYPVWTNHICVYSVAGQGSCNGDSGGPIVLPGAAGGTDVLVGIVSFSVNPCGLHPAFNVKVYNYLAWIVEARKNLLDASRIHF